MITNQLNMNYPEHRSFKAVTNLQGWAYKKNQVIFFQALRNFDSSNC